MAGFRLPAGDDVFGGAGEPDPGGAAVTGVVPRRESERVTSTVKVHIMWNLIFDALTACGKEEGTEMVKLASVNVQISLNQQIVNG